MDAADPLCAISSPARLLPRTLSPGPVSATAASPSKAREALLEAIALARQLKGSEELVKQAKLVLKEHGDIRVLYHDYGVEARPPANGNKEQQGRMPSLDRRRAHFTMKHTSSKPVPVVDQSKLSNISDPVEFFMTLDRLGEAEEEIKQLNGETKKRVLNFDPVDEPKRRPGMRGRKSIRSFKVVEDAETHDPIEVPAPQTETMTESQLSQDDMHAVADKNEQSVHSRSGEQAISDVSGKEDSLAEKDGCDDLTYLLTSLQDLDESEEEDFIRKTLGIKKIRKDKVSLRNSIPGVRSLRSNTLQKSAMRVRPPESPLPLSRQDRISELEKHLFPGDAANDKCTDDKSEDSPDIVMGEPSLVHDASDVLMTDEIFTASEIDRETPNLVVREAECVLDPEPNMPDHADERQPGASSLGLYGNTEVGKEKVACSRDNISVEEGDVPVDYPTIGRSHNETEVSSHHVEGRSAEVLVSTSGRHVDPDGIDRTSHASEDSIQHLEVVKDGGVLQDKSSQPVEMPLEDIDPLNQPQMPGESIKKLAHDLHNALSPTKQKKQQAAQNGERKQQSKRGKKVADKSSQPVELPLEDIDSLNQTQMQGESIKKLAHDLHNAPSPTKQKKQQAAQKGKRKQQSKRGRKVADESNHALEIPQANFGSEQENFGSENQSQDDVNIERQTVVMSNALSPNEEKGQKGAQRRNKTKELNKRKSLGDAGLAWQSGVRRSTRVRSRPLEHWLGERFVYGRIHDTMVTVVGIKAYSPSQDGKKELKVKSFVPEQYSDIVAESAKY